jgi:hypothetical protein
LYVTLSKHPTHIQVSITLPTRPHAIFSTFATQTKPTHNSEPCKREKNANAKAHPQPTGRNTYKLHLKHQQDIIASLFDMAIGKETNIIKLLQTILIGTTSMKGICREKYAADPLSNNYCKDFTSNDKAETVSKFYNHFIKHFANWTILA